MDCVIVGAGPAGLRAAQVLAEAGREVLVLERNAEVGPKTCGGGLSVKAVRELDALGLPADAGLHLVAHAAFGSDEVLPLDPERAAIRTISRRRLGAIQCAWARRAGAGIRTATPASDIDLRARTLRAGDRRIHWRTLIGADGSRSAVRRALGLPSPREFFAAEFNVPGVRRDRLSVEFDAPVLASGYFWVFPHEDYLCVGAGGPKHLVPPATVRPYLERRLRALDVEVGDTPYEGATIEVEYVGLDFPGGVHLVGDAAGAPSGLTAEGIYAALITGEEVARSVLEPTCPRTKTAAWLRIKRWHDRVGRAWLRPAARHASFAVMPALCRGAATRRWLSGFFLEG